MKTNQNVKKHLREGDPKWWRYFIMTCAFASVVALVVLLGLHQQESKPLFDRVTLGLFAVSIVLVVLAFIPALPSDRGRTPVKAV